MLQGTLYSNGQDHFENQLPDGRWLMASYEDLYALFRENHKYSSTIFQTTTIVLAVQTMRL